MFRKFFKYVTQSMAGMIGISIYILADTFFISLHSGANGLTVLNLILPVYGVLYAIGAMIGIGSATRYCIIKSKGKNADCYFGQSLMWSILFSIPFVLCGILFPANILKILGADASLVERFIFESFCSGRCFLCQTIRSRHLPETMTHRQGPCWHRLSEACLTLCSTIFSCFR